MAAPLADFPFEAAGVVEVMFAPDFTEFPFPFAAVFAGAAADVADLVGLELFEFEFEEFITPFFAEFSAAVEFSLLFGEIGKSSSVAG